MAAVYLAAHKIGRRDAIKILHPEVASSPDLKARFEREAEATNRFKHPGAVEIRDFDVTEDGCPFLVMEHLEGESLGERARRLGGIPEDELLRYVDELCDVLAAAHKEGIVHRDIKLDNLFVTTDGRLKVLDFGIARVRSGPSLTLTGTRLGTTAYMPPEQIAGGEIDGRADLFAVGATMFRLLAKRRIHEAPTDGELVVKMSTEPAPPIRSVAPDVGEHVAKIVDLALAFKAADRYPNALTMQEDVRAVQRGEPPPFATARLARGGAPLVGAYTAFEPTGVVEARARAAANDPTEAPRAPTPPRPGAPRPAPRPTMAGAKIAPPAAQISTGANAFASSPTAVTQAPMPVAPSVAPSSTVALGAGQLTPVPGPMGPGPSPSTPLSMAVPARPASTPPPSVAAPPSMSTPAPPAHGAQASSASIPLAGGSMGPASFGAGSMGPASFAAGSMGATPIGVGSLGPGSMGPGSMGPASMGPSGPASLRRTGGFGEGPVSQGPPSMTSSTPIVAAAPGWGPEPTSLRAPGLGPAAAPKKGRGAAVLAVVGLLGALVLAAVGGTAYYLNAGASASHKSSSLSDDDAASDDEASSPKDAKSASATPQPSAPPSSSPGPTSSSQAAPAATGGPSVPPSEGSSAHESAKGGALPSPQSGGPTPTSTPTSAPTAHPVATPAPQPSSGAPGKPTHGVPGTTSTPVATSSPVVSPPVGGPGHEGPGKSENRGKKGPPKK
jgi:serine/threonine-protein kinase